MGPSLGFEWGPVYQVVVAMVAVVAIPFFCYYFNADDDHRCAIVWVLCIAAGCVLCALL